MLLFLFVTYLWTFESMPQLGQPSSMSIHTHHLLWFVHTHAHVCVHNTVTLIYILSLRSQYPDLKSSVRKSGELGPHWQGVECLTFRLEVESHSKASESAGQKHATPYWARFLGHRLVDISPTLTLSSWSCGLQSRKIRTYGQASDFQQDFCEF